MFKSYAFPATHGQVKLDVNPLELELQVKHFVGLLGSQVLQLEFTLQRTHAILEEE